MRGYDGISFSILYPTFWKFQTCSNALGLAKKVKPNTWAQCSPTLRISNLMSKRFMRNQREKLWESFSLLEKMVWGRKCPKSGWDFPKVLSRKMHQGCRTPEKWRDYIPIPTYLNPSFRYEPKREGKRDGKTQEKGQKHPSFNY